MVCAGAAGSSTDRTMEVGGRTRTFIEHVPAGFSADTKYPAIIAFPGRGESAGELEAYSQLDSVGAIVLYAQGLPGAGGQPAWESTPYQGPPRMTTSSPPTWSDCSPTDPVSIRTSST
jgi:polyhydroxybutyrate depolymerase